MCITICRRMTQLMVKQSRIKCIVPNEQFHQHITIKSLYTTAKKNDLKDYICISLHPLCFVF